MGTYQSASQLVSYLANLGVTVVRIMSLEPAICFSSLIDSRCWKRRSNVYEGVQHPAYGSQEDLIALVQAIHTKGMLVMIDVDWSGLSRYSDFYDYDGSSIPTSFGPLFQATYDTYEYQAKTCKKFDLSSGSAGETIVSSALSRLATVFGFDGIYWRGLMCLRLDSSNLTPWRPRWYTARSTLLAAMAMWPWAPRPGALLNSTAEPAKLEELPGL